MTIRDDVIIIGEVGLAGEIRSVSQIGKRVNEASRLGFKRCVVPYYNLKSITPEAAAGMEIIGVKSIRQAVEAAVGAARAAGQYTHKG